ncbi:hypothetical protein AvCA_32490 [Azotobacter vinelandii CA]|uniref:Uncharacterized protein n=2 Tax=Azotobacter vinelandii TaxID=354 RepID=C1DP55_AZOVD|nr:hypothetical protein Avin_32490 [Azotobacter vinelandii DJ]AGK16387.1 hypothetical protein AvCA_32490 [Azotobacter vinelandii CA]AGK21201.1 hypothetical protein AvCA6_32490 [Azotobacter vinelandii CA6]
MEQRHGMGAWYLPDGNGAGGKPGRQVHRRNGSKVRTSEGL